MWVSVPTLVLVGFVAVQNVVGYTEPHIISESILPTDDQGSEHDKPAISLEYKPIKPSYLSSTSNVAQIVPPGQPWPANAAGYANFSQINHMVTTKPKIDGDVSLLQSAPTPSNTNIINLDMSNPNTNFAEALEKVLAPLLANVKISDKQQTISTTLNVTPPPNANMDFVKALQAAVRVVISKLLPSAGTSLRIAITKSSSGAIVNVKANLDVILNAAVNNITPNLPPSTVPEIDLSKSSSGLQQNLEIILLKELSQAGYNANSKSIQNFALSFSVLPPEGATQDYVRLYVLKPLQEVLKRVAPGSAITSVSVNTQESNGKILRQTVKLNVQIVPPSDEKNENVVEVPEVDLSAAGTNVISTVVTTLQNQIMKNVGVNPTQAKTLSIPFKITPPKDATQQQIQDLYITPISQVLSKLDPTGKIMTISQKTLPNGDIIIIVYMNIPSNATTNTSSNSQIQPVVVSVTKTEKPSAEGQTFVNIENRNAFPDEEEDEIPSEITNYEEPSESTESETTKPSSNGNVVPVNSIRTSVVDLTTPTASVNNIQRILDEELSPLSNPVDDGQSKVLAIPFRMKPPAGATLQQIDENVVVPIGKLLTDLEPTGNVITSQTKALPNGDVESVVYFNIPSVKDSKTYKVISDELQTQKPSTIIPGQAVSTEAPVTPREAQEPVISPIKKLPQTQEPNVKLPQNTVETSPIDLSHPNFDALKNGIEQRLNEIIKSKPSENDESQTVGFPFVVPKEQATRIPIMAQAIATLLKGLVPSGKALPTLSPKVLSNGDVEFTIYYEIPTITRNKPDEEVIEGQTKPSVAPKIPKVKQPETQNEVQFKNAIVTSPIDLKQPNYANLPADIERRVSEVRKTSDGQPQVVGIPFVLAKNQKPNFLLTQALKTVLKTIEPSGNIVQVTEPKTLPNGDNEFIIYDELPAVTNEKPNKKAIEGQTNPSLEPTIPKIIRETKHPENQNEVQFKNAIVTSPIDLKQPNYANLPADIDRIVSEVRKTSDGKPQVVGIPFVLAKNQKPSFLLTQALKTALKNIVPSGNIVQVTEPKTLPNGDNEFIIYDELPAVTNEKPNKEAVEGQTYPSLEPTIPKIIRETKHPENQNEVQFKNAIVTSPIDLKQPNYANLPADIDRIVSEVRKTSDGKPQVVGIPFVLAKNQKPNFLLTQALKTVLKTIEPSGNIVQVTEPKTLPNGDNEFIIYDELPAVTNKKPNKAAIEGQTNPSVVPIIPKIIRETKHPENQNELQFKNAIVTSPIDLKQPNYANLPADIDRIVSEVRKTSDGQPQLVGIPFVLAKNQKPSFFLTQSLKTVLKTMVPSGNIVQVTEPKTLPNGDTEFIIYDELPGLEKKNEKIVENIVPAVAVEDVNLDEPGVTVEGEVGKALTKAISTISSNPNDLNKPANLKFNIYAPLDDSLSQNKKLIDEVLSELRNLEPNTKVIAKTNEKPQSNGPDGVIEIMLPSVASSKTAQNLKNALKIPTIDINQPGLKLVDTIKSTLQKGLKSVGQLNPESSQLFDLKFGLNPFDTKGSVAEVLKALRAVDPKGQIVSYKLTSGPDGFEYLDVMYLITKLEDSIIYDIAKPEEVVYESFVDIDTRNPLSGLLDKVIKEVGAAEDEVRGAKKGQLVELPLDFKFSNSKGFSDSKVSEIISQTLPSIEGYISQILPDGKIISVDTVALPTSDDVILKIVVRTPYEPDNTIVIEEVRPKVRTVVTTPKPKRRGLFGLHLGL